MRFLQSFNDQTVAQRFGDILLTHGIQNDVESDEGSFTVWVHDEDRLTEASDILAQFKSNPESSEFSGAAAEARSIRSRMQKENRDFNRRIKDGRTAFHRNRSFSAGPVTLFLIFVCVAVFILQMIGDWNAIFNMLAISSDPGIGLKQIASGQVWRLITPAIMHGDFFHIFFNCWWLMLLGGMVEDRISSRFLLQLVVGLAVLSNLVQYFFAGPSFLGISGVNYGLFGFIWIMGRRDALSGFLLPQSTIYIMLGFFILCWLGAFGGIANWAHTGGLAGGCLAAFVRSKFFPS